MNPLTITSLFDIGREIISRVWPDPRDQAEELRKLEELRQKGDLAELQAYLQVLQGRMSIIQSEAESEHVLTASWRPIIMLVFAGLIVARFLGLSADGVSESEYLALWNILELGIGGYVVGRSAEKIVKEYKKK